MARFQTTVLFTMGMFTALAQQPSGGTDLWASFVPNAYGGEARRLIITCASPTSGMVSIPLEGLSIPFNVVPEVATVLDLPAGPGEPDSGGPGSGGIHITSAASISVLAGSVQNYSVDGTALLSSEWLGATYRISSYPGLSGFGDFYTSEFIVLAHENGTVVEIVPNAATKDGHAAGAGFMVELDAGETWLVHAALASSDLSGSTVSVVPGNAPCRSFSVFSGTRCATVPTNCNACDVLYEQELPTDRWGLTGYFAPFEGASGFTLRVLANENQTHVSVDGGFPITLAAGAWLELTDQQNAVCVQADKPISTSQYMQGVACSIVGDPSLMRVVPSTAAVTEATFSTLGALYTEDTHFVTIVCGTGDLATVSVDGLVPTGTQAQTFSACPAMSFMHIPLLPGAHDVRCPGGCHPYVYGWQHGSSYAYAVLPGTSFSTAQDSVICALSGTTLELTSPLPLFEPEWRVASDPGTVVSTEAILSITASANERYRVRDASGSWCGEYVFSISLSDPIAVDILIDGIAQDSTGRCNGEPNPVFAQFSGTGGGYIYHWSGLTAYQSEIPQYTIPAGSSSGWQYIEVSAPGGCAYALDSVWLQHTTLPGSVVIYEQNGTLHCALSGYNYQWLLNDVPIEGATGQSFIPQNSGVYSVLVSDELGCEVGSFTTNIVLTGLYEPEAAAIGVLYDGAESSLRVTGVRGSFTLLIRSMTGQVVRATSGQGGATVPLPMLADGVYAVSVFANGRLTTVRTQIRGNRER